MDPIDHEMALDTHPPNADADLSNLSEHDSDDDDSLDLASRDATRPAGRSDEQRQAARNARLALHSQYAQADARPKRFGELQQPAGSSEPSSATPHSGVEFRKDGNGDSAMSLQSRQGGGGGAGVGAGVGPGGVSHGTAHQPSSSSPSPSTHRQQTNAMVLHPQDESSRMEVDDVDGEISSSTHERLDNDDDDNNDDEYRDVLVRAMRVLFTRERLHREVEEAASSQLTEQHEQQIRARQRQQDDEDAYFDSESPSESFHEYNFQRPW
ncbi:hypothetical protein CAOG_002114 [Capsaspora owczarzaki ATCC 30864]|uniref:Uncharacterized protein n=1 Tax=Capsaspora owczarzaki (strain ATCC 30864) TaxID=595528 RepID=A0A0D2U6S7_CAPO3|nr:hypothetical protein CAOG_002114 [Capsaspora owczarzaki ATCC 30864]